MLIADSRPSVLAAWRKAFAAEPGVDFETASTETFRTSRSLDALVLPAILVEERFGARATPGESTVVRSDGRFGLPPFLVTTPAFDGVINGHGVVEMVDNWSTSSEWRIILKEVFKAVDSFQSTAPGSIRIVGMHLELLASSEDDAEDEAAGAARGFREHAGGGHV